MTGPTDGKSNIPGIKTFTMDVEKASRDLGIETPPGEIALVEHTSPKQSRVVPKHTDSILTNTDDVFDVSRAFDTNKEVGTLITDKRLHRAGIGAVLKGAFTEWVGNQKETLEESSFFKKKVKPMVTAPASRKDVITEAAKVSRQAPRDDHQIVIKKLRAELPPEKATRIEKPFILKESVNVAPSWAYQRELEKELNPVPIPESGVKPVPPQVSTATGASPLATPVISPTKIVDASAPLPRHTVGPQHSHHAEPETYKSPASKVIEQEDPKSSSPVPERMVEAPKETAQKYASTPIPQSPEQPRTEVTPHAPEKSPELGSAEWTHYAEKTGKSESVSKPLPQKSGFEGVSYQNTNIKKETLPAKPTAEVPSAARFEAPVREYITPPDEAIPIEQTPAVPARAPRERFAAPDAASGVPHIRVNTVLIMLFMTLAGVGGGIGAAYFFGVLPKEKESVVETIPSFLITERQLPVPLDTQRAAFMKELSDTIRFTDVRTLQVYPTMKGGALDAETPASTEAIMTLIAPRAPGNFLRSLEPVSMIGGTEGKPFLIFKTNSFDVAFAGMIAWEPYIVEDLAPIFGRKVEKSSIPQGTDAADSVSPRFTDATKNNRSIRILYDETGRERIIYAFVSRNMLIITQDTESLSRILDQL